MTFKWLIILFYFLNQGDTLLHDIPELVSPDLLEALGAMGRGDKIVVANLNFPAASTCRGPERPLLVRADGHRTADLLEAIVKLLPVENEAWVLEKQDDYYDDGDERNFDDT